MSKTTIPAGGIADSAVTTAKINADAVDATKIADDAISEEHLDATAITGHTALAESPADTDEFLISDGGTLKRIDASYVGGGAWQLIYSDNVTGHAQTNAYSNSALFSSDYNFYRVYILDWEPQNDSVDMNLQLKLGGVTRTSNYKFHLRRHESESAEKTGAYDNSASSIRIMEGCGNGTSEVMSGWFEYQNPTGDNGNFYCTVAKYSGVESNQYAIGGMGHGTCVDSTGAMTGFTISAHSGGLGSYNLRAYGLKQS